MRFKRNFALLLFLILTLITAWAGINVWTSVGLSDKDVRVISVDPANSSTIYAGTWYEGIFRSIDGGFNWDELEIPITQSFTSIEFDFLNPQIIYVLSYSGLFKSTDSGNTWNVVDVGAMANLLVIDSQIPSTLYLGL